jgi:cell division septal protein FtsQ
MKKLVIAAGAAVLLAMSSLAAMADEASGSITDIDDSAMTVTLDDGNVYALPSDVDPASLQVGDSVTIEYTKDADGNLVAATVDFNN